MYVKTYDKKKQSLSIRVYNLYNIHSNNYLYINKKFYLFVITIIYH